MTVTTNNTENIFSGTGVATVFPTNIYAVLSTQIKVYLRENDVDTLQVIAASYTLSNLGSEDGVSVTFLVPPTNTQEVVIVRDTEKTQELDLTSSRAYNPAVLMYTLDLIVMMVQEIGQQQSRTFRVKPGITTPVELEDPDALTNALDFLVSALNDSSWISSPLLAFLADDEVVTGDWLFNATLGQSFAGANSPVRRVLLERTATTLLRRFYDAAGANPISIETTTHDDTGATKFEWFLSGVLGMQLDSTALKPNKLKWGSAVNLGAVDLNTITEGGFYYINSSSTNRPDSSSQAWYLMVSPRQSTDLVQVAFRDAVNNSQIAIRQQSLSNGWTAWRTIGARDVSDGNAVSSGTSVDFTAVPIFATKVVISVKDLSATAAAELAFRLRAATVGLISSGYTTTSSQFAAAAVSSVFSVNDRLTLAQLASGVDLYNGTITLTKRGGTNVWDIQSQARIAAAQCVSWGSVDVGSTGLNGFRLYLSANTFDGSGTFDVSWET